MCYDFCDNSSFVLFVLLDFVSRTTCLAKKIETMVYVSSLMSFPNTAILSVYWCTNQYHFTLTSLQRSTIYILYLTGMECLTRSFKDVGGFHDGGGPLEFTARSGIFSHDRGRLTLCGDPSRCVFRFTAHV